MYLINRYTLNLPNVICQLHFNLKNPPILLCAFYLSCFLFFYSSSVLSGYFLLFHFHPSLTLEIRVSGYP